MAITFVMLKHISPEGVFQHRQCNGIEQAEQAWRWWALAQGLLLAVFVVLMANFNKGYRSVRDSIS